MKKIIPLMGAIAVYAALAESGHAVIGLIFGIILGLLAQYVFANFFNRQQKVVSQGIRLVERKDNHNGEN